jgi:hypothetical protein
MMAANPRSVIKIGISNKTYLPASLESYEWSVHSFISQTKQFYGSLVNMVRP